ncbi:MAG: hypothetical protein GF419_00685, partial [Ignavibacteriales bacterium]|nr:hypothetical protein [Ignavibacteriales bacterium]
MRSFATIGKAATAFALCATFLASAQIESSIQIFNRGKLWQSVDLGKSGPNFNNWTRRGIGLDWPGFDETLIGENIGGAPSHMVAGGLYVGAEKKPDSVLSVEEWCLYAGSITEGASGKYVVKKHTRVFKDGANHWLASEPEMGEEVVETVWEYNLLHENEYNIERMLPIRVTRRVHQWSGSRAHENYVIHDYVIENIADEIRANVPADRYVADTMYNFYALLNYGLHCNSRSWAALFPSYTPGARNTWFRYDKRRRLVLGRAADYPLTPEKNEELGRSNSLGMIIDGEPTGEYLAPGFVGVKLLYSSPDKTGEESNVGQQGWSAASSTLDLSGPMANIGSAEAQYNALEDIRLAASFVESPFDTTFMRRSRMWSLMRLGPWDIAPGESIRIAWAEVVDGVDYSVAVRPDKNASNTVISQSQDIFYETADKAQLTFDNGFNHPDPPAAPEFRIDFNRGAEDVANVIRWGTETETMPDPDDGTLDLEGYVLYRASFLPIGPWTAIDTIDKGDATYLAGGEYEYVDYDVDVGKSYYYALTAYDGGKASWPVNPSQRFSETGSNAVPPLESSLYANRTRTPFVATLPPASNLDEALVVPNPYVIGEGYSSPGAEDVIQFVNIPN